MNSRAKGKRRELEVIRDYFAPHWPECTRNYNQYADKKMDVLELPGLHVQVKGVEKLNVWKALDQTITEAATTDLPVLAFRRNWDRSPLPSRSLWFGAVELSELIALLRLREA